MQKGPSSTNPHGHLSQIPMSVPYGGLPVPSCCGWVKIITDSLVYAAICEI